MGQICPLDLKFLSTFPHGLQNNHACKWISENFPGITHVLAFLEKCKKSICRHCCSPIYKERSLSLFEFHVVPIWQCNLCSRYATYMLHTQHLNGAQQKFLNWQHAINFISQESTSPSSYILLAIGLSLQTSWLLPRRVCFQLGCLVNHENTNIQICTHLICLPNILYIKFWYDVALSHIFYFCKTKSFAKCFSFCNIHILKMYHLLLSSSLILC